jgi:hypothetical protein
MPYASVDTLQKALAKDIFHYAKDAKKASGRALGNLVEIITFHLIRSWGFERSLSIERRIPEYGNRALTHNVEFSLHPALRTLQIPLEKVTLPIRSSTLVDAFEAEFGIAWKYKPHPSNAILSKQLVLRNSCSVGVWLA